MPFKSEKQRRYYFGCVKGGKMKVKIRKHVRLVGQHQGNTILIDNDLPKKWRPTIIKHEFVETEAMKQGVSYPKAHKIAENVEKKTFRGSKNEWKRYMKNVEKIYQKENKYARSA